MNATAVSVRLHDRPVETVFGLLGDDEESMTHSLGWVLGNCPAFLSLFLGRVARQRARRREVQVLLQESKRGSGRTDIEIREPERSLVVIEAKKGRTIPTRSQLQRYALRFRGPWRNPKDHRLLVLSRCSPEYVRSRLPRVVGDGVAVRHVSWDEIRQLLDNARSTASYRERWLMDELSTHIEGEGIMERNESNLVYVVSLAAGTPDGWGISWRDIVRKRNKYFHPVGNHWPQEPPNYVAFRYDGKVRSIHHIEKHDTMTRPHDHVAEIPANLKWEPHFIYWLGPSIGPPEPLPSGKQYRATRLWCMLDTLLTSPTLAKAHETTEKRRSQT